MDDDLSHGRPRAPAEAPPPKVRTLAAAREAIGQVTRASSASRHAPITGCARAAKPGGRAGEIQRGYLTGQKADH
jgi:hypothetical protein